MQNTRIFPNSTRTTRAKENLQRASETLKKMQQALRYPTQQTTQQIENLSRQLASSLRGTGGMLPVERQLIRMAESIERMARNQQESFVNRVLSVMGEPGQLISSWLRSSSGSQSLNPIKTEIQNAMNILGQFAGSLTENEMTPEQAGGTRLPDWVDERTAPTPPPQNRLPSSAGSGGSSGRGEDERRGDNNGLHRNVTMLPDGRLRVRGPGFERTYEPDDELLTGEAIRVQSSNVHSISYRFSYDNPLKGQLIVRYLQKDRKGGSGNAGGPTYMYKSVHPDWFNDLKTASSKGKWIWDQLRIRGTVAGHQYEYTLERAAQGYLPRRALVDRHGNQKLRRRRRTALHSNGREEIMESPLPNQTLGRYSPPRGENARPNYGNRRPVSTRPDVGDRNRGR